MKYLDKIKRELDYQGGDVWSVLQLDIISHIEDKEKDLEVKPLCNTYEAMALSGQWPSNVNDVVKASLSE